MDRTPAARLAAVDPPPDLIDSIARYDERLRQGAVQPSTHAAGSAEATPDPEHSLFRCLDFLERAWPRRGEPHTSPPPQRIGKFEIERILGHGGFGVVYLARDTHLGRTVALKVPRLHTLASRSLLERFQREARAAAALDHPHIVPVYEAGDDNGLCYIASAYSPGPNLAQWLREQPAPVAPHISAQIVAMLADAVAYSHSQGILHRDIKPGNVMLGPASVHSSTSGEDRPPSPNSLPFVPRLGDFGLAKFALDAAAQSAAHDESAGTAILGTPAYMAPEQLERGGAAVGAAADLYALGVVLYELLVGRPPFQGGSVVDILDQVRTTDPVPLRRMRRDVPRDLETICLTCLAKSPAHRYRTADALRDDLLRFLDGRPIQARPPGAMDVVLKWVRRRPTVAALVATVAALTVGLIALQSWHAAQLRRSNEDLKIAIQQVTDEKSRAVASEHEARGIAYALDIQCAWRAREEGDFAEFSRIVDRYRDGAPLAQFRGQEWHYLQRFTRTEQRTLLSLETPIYDIVFGQQGQAAAVGEDAQVRIVDLRSGEITASWPTGQVEVNSACFMPDGKSLWTAGDDGTVRCWDVASQAQIQRIDAHAGAKAFKVKYSAALNVLLTCGTEGPIRVWDLSRGGSAAGALDGHTDWVQDVILTHDGRRVLSVSDDHTVRLWDLTSRTETWRHATERWKVRDVALSPDGRHFATCSDRLRVFNIDALDVPFELTVIDEARMVGFSNDGERMYVSDRQGIVHVYNLVCDDHAQVVGAEEFGQWRAHDSALYALRASPVDQSILTAGKDGRVKQWYAIGAAPPPRVITQSHDVQALKFDPHGRWLAIGGKTKLALYNYQRLHDPPLIVADHGNWTALDIDHAGRTMAAGSSTGEVRLWDIDHLHSRVLIQGQTTVDPDDSTNGAGIAALSFSHDNGVLAVAAQGTHVLILDPRTGVERQRIEVGMADGAKLSPTEDVLATTTAEHRIELWHWPTALRLWQSEKYAERPGWVVFSPDGRLVLADTGDRTIRIFDRATGEIVRELGQHRAQILRMTMSPDGRTIATKDDAGRVHFWHAASGQLLYVLPSSEPTSGYENIDFSPDGRWLAFRSGLDDVQLVPIHP